MSASFACCPSFGVTLKTPDFFQPEVTITVFRHALIDVNHRILKATCACSLTAAFTLHLNCIGTVHDKLEEMQTAIAPFSSRTPIFNLQRCADETFILQQQIPRNSSEFSSTLFSHQNACGGQNSRARLRSKARTRRINKYVTLSTSRTQANYVQ
jgi:hypothetical protein